MMYVSQIIMLYTLNLYSAICQLQLKETERTEIKERKREREKERETRRERKKRGRKEGRGSKGGRKLPKKKKNQTETYLACTWILISLPGFYEFTTSHVVHKLFTSKYGWKSKLERLFVSIICLELMNFKKGKVAEF